MSKEHLNYLRRKTADESELWAADRIEELERERNELKAAIQNFLCAWDGCRSSGEWPVRRLEELRAAIAKGEKNG